MLHVEVITETGCWIWMKSVNKATGYGMCWGFEGNPRTQAAHRVAYKLFKGPIPSDKQVLHSCHVRCCVNPNHLRLGTAKENADDRDKVGHTAKGERHGTRRNPPYLPRGEKHWRCKVTKEDAFYIRHSDESLRAMYLSGRFGLSLTQLWRIRKGMSWVEV